MSRGPNQAGEIYVAIKGDATQLNQAVQDANRTAQEQNQRNAGSSATPGASTMDALLGDASAVNIQSAKDMIRQVAEGSFLLGQEIGKIVFNIHALNQEFETIRDTMSQQNAFMFKIMEDLKKRAQGSDVEGLGDMSIEKRKELVTKQGELIAEIAASKDSGLSQAWDIFRKNYQLGMYENALPSLEAGKEQKLAEVEKSLKEGQSQYEAFVTRANEETLKGYGRRLGLDTSGISYDAMTPGERAAITFGGASGGTTEIVNALIEIRKVNEAMEQSLRRLNTAPLNVVTKPERDQGDNK